MRHSTAKTDFRQALGLHPDFPLFPHASGRWAKKVRQSLVYFGKVVDDPKGEKALKKWLDEKDDLIAGRRPRNRAGQLTVSDLCNHFLGHKEALQLSGELAPRTFIRYSNTCAFLTAAFGRNRVVEDLTAQDFQELRSSMSKRWGAVALANEIQIVRSVFRFGYESGFIQSPVRFGPAFKKPSAKTIRQARAANGPRMFSAAEIQAALKHATPNMRAMLLLAINGALGNTDLALLPIAAVDLAGCWLNYPRAKTAISRRIPLWKETADAIRKVLSGRKAPNNADDAGLLFVGRRGESYVGNHRGYRVHQEAARVFAAAGIPDRTFYDLRRTFQTVAEGSRDLSAVQAIMGHAPASADMSAIYRQGVDDTRLLAVVETVRKWLYAKPAKAPKAKAASTRKPKTTGQAKSVVG